MVRQVVRPCLGSASRQNQQCVLRGFPSAMLPAPDTRLTVPTATLRRGPFLSSLGRSELVWDRIVWIGVVVESLPALPSVPASHHQALEQWRRSKAALRKLVEHHMSNVISGV